MNGRLIVFTRCPVPGEVKTRLIPAIGAEAAAALQQRLTMHTLDVASRAVRQCGYELEVRYSGGSLEEMESRFGGGPRYRPQGEGDFADRMREALRDALTGGCDAAILVASDVPELRAATLSRAMNALRHADVVLGPTSDGGTYLTGFTRDVQHYFDAIDWRAALDLKALAKAWLEGIAIEVIDTLTDVDTAEDLARVPRRWLRQAGIAERRDAIPE